ncbi:MAG: hypothetical protein IPK64_06120 [bacterium]|nr:hypothetical protein [bacterium]
MAWNVRQLLPAWPLIGALLALAAAAPAGATWSHDAIVNDALCTNAATQQSVQVAPDGLGGWIVAWIDARGGGNPAIYAQRVNPSGSRAWATDGVLAYQSAGFFTEFVLVGDGQGGAFLAAVDSQDALQYHVYLQRLNPSGSRVLGTGGVAAVAGSASAQADPALVNTESGVAVVVFVDSRTAGGDIYAQRITSSGTLTWGSGGAVVCGVAEAQGAPRAVADGAGGVLAFWEDERDFVSTGIDLYGQRLNAAGVQAWTAAGAVVSTAGLRQQDLAVAADGSGGALLAWLDERSVAISGIDIYAQRLNGAGTARWFNNGRPVCTAIGDQVAVAVAADPYGGAFLAWTDGRIDAWMGDQVYAQALAGDGLPRWAENGQPAAGADGNQLGPVAVATDAASVALVWQDERTGIADVRGQRLDPAGAAQWGAAGLLVSGAPFVQSGVAAAAGADGEVMAAWEDERLAFDIYMQRVDRSGWLGDPAPDVASAVDRPADQGGVVRLTWDASWLDAWGQPGVDTYHVLGRRPGAKAQGTGPESLRAWLLDGWTAMAQVPPLQLASYAADVPTYGVWTAQEQPWTEYLVVAEAGGFLLASGVIAGYSVDNLAPGAPLSLAAATDHFDVLLVWTPSGQDDEDVSHYNLYRSADPGFVPGPSSLLEEVAATNYAEVRVPQGTWYFRVTAVDIHGNEGPPSNVAGMLSLVSVNDRPAATVPVVSAAVPNPFNPSTEILCELPRDARAQLVIHDLGGRVVRRLLDADLPAGPFAVRWDGCDQAGRDLPSGVYLARLTSVGHESVRKLVLAR